MKRQATDCEKMFAKHISNEGFRSEIQELLQLNNKIIKFLRWANYLKRQFIKEDRQKAIYDMKRCSV